MTEPGMVPPVVAIVVLPFFDDASAVEFANLVRARQGGQTAIVAGGTAYEYQVETTGETGQVVEFVGWETWADPARPDVAILKRVTSDS